MINKENESTPQRPEGHHLLDSELFTIDIPENIKRIKNEPSSADSDRNAITLLKTPDLRILLMALHSGAELKPHKAAGTLSLQVLEGRIEFHTEKKSLEAGSGQVIVLHPDILHSVYAKEDSTLLLTLAMVKS